MIQKLWHNLFLVERPSIGLSFFRIFVALTAIFVMYPTFIHLSDTYLPTAYFELNSFFFPIEFLLWIHKSPSWVVITFVWIFIASSLAFLFGLFSRISCIVMTVCCYYFYALNSFAMGTLSWDIFLVTLVPMCIVNYHGDYFSLDCLFKKDRYAYRIKRPFFLQRLFQMQIGFIFFYTALHKITVQGNWIKDNPIYYLMNLPPQGVTKNFLLKDVLRDTPDLCYWIGISIIAVEFLLIFFLAWRKTRVTAIILGIFFHVILILTLDVPATFFFLFPAMFLLFINPVKIVDWIEDIRRKNTNTRRFKVVYDGQCRLCLNSVDKLKVMDLFGTLKFVDFQTIDNLKTLHANLTKQDAMRQLHVIDSAGRLHGGFFVFRKISLGIPMLWPLLPVFYFPGAGIIGPVVYHFVAKNRYRFFGRKSCDTGSCSL